MNDFEIDFQGETLTLVPSGALYWARVGLLVVADLHLGKSDRIARRSGQMLPPYETTETLAKLSDTVDLYQPEIIMCLGDTFDDLDAVQSLSDGEIATITRLQAGRRWLWLEGNHDPGPIELGGEHLAEFQEGPLTFRHIAEDNCAAGEISGHYHPKAQIKGMSRPCFLVDETRMIVPAFGSYTGGLRWNEPVLRNLFNQKAMAYLTGRQILPAPMPKAR
jgi:DNA ligase-associated metallophosphoesterase